MTAQPSQNLILPTTNNLIRVDFKNHDEWLKGRTMGLGGSDAAAIIGRNPWKTNVQLWEEKTGRSIPTDISGKPEVIYGKKAEAPLRELFILDYPEYEVYYKEYEGLYQKDYPFLKASLDGELIEIESGRKGIYEGKTTNILQSMQREKWNDQIPYNYFCQVLHYFIVTGYDFAILKAQLKTVWDKEIRLATRHYPIERSNHLADIEYLFNAEVYFWTVNVLQDIKPNLIFPAI